MDSSLVTKIVQSVDKLEPLPGSVTRVLKALEDPVITAGMIADLIGLDQALAAIVLQMANSAALGFGSTCSNLASAVMRVGFKRIKVLVLGAGASGPLKGRLSGYHIGGGDLWNHGIATATAAQWLSRKLAYPDPEEAYVAGLLHDMGKIILDQYVLSGYDEMLQKMRDERMLLWQVEEQMIGIDHATVGGLMAEKWHFPAGLVESIRYHHYPSLSMDKERLSAIINIANATAFRPDIAFTDLSSTIAHPEALRILGLADNSVDQLTKQMADSMKMR